VSKSPKTSKNEMLIMQDCNVGLFVRNDDEYEWLCSLLTIPKIKQLLGPEYNGQGVDRLCVTAPLNPVLAFSIMLIFAAKFPASKPSTSCCTTILIGAITPVARTTDLGRTVASICERSMLTYRTSFCEGVGFESQAWVYMQNHYYYFTQ
jgi:hypothetical protein